MNNAVTMIKNNSRKSNFSVIVTCCDCGQLHAVPASPWGPGGPGSPSLPSRPAVLWSHPLAVSLLTWRAFLDVMGPAAVGVENRGGRSG